MATVNTAEIERVVRRVLNQQGDVKATLKAIQRVSTLITEEVIPKLPEDGASNGADDDGNQAEAMSARAVPSDDGSQDDDQPDVPEGDDQQSEHEIPDAVMQAFEQLYQTLEPEQATALAELFKAVGGELGDGEDSGENADQDVDQNVDQNEGRGQVSRAG